MKILTYIALWTVLLTALFTACKGTAEDKKEIAQAVDEKPEIRLYTFDGGTVQVNKLELFSQDSVYRGKSKEFANAFYVIQHPKGNLMWDAGLPEALVPMQEPFTSPDGNFTVSRSDSVQNQLAKAGMTMEDIDYIALSHTHFDHSGHAARMEHSLWLVQKAEYDFITSPEIQKSYPNEYNAVKDIGDLKKIEGDHDVFGDGSVVIKLMPGHTPGHSVLYLDLKEHGPILLTGDLYHLYANRKNKRVPIFNYDVKQTLESMDRFERFAEETGAEVYLQHQKEDFDKMPKAPNFLN
ncbi:N-acyl homoserine lactonase family protein [Robiginitalea aurantiaca]|uniref:N-acyl homoserine lactonase family protein n=1 Tax=Robiginitalea aurantiaca TaxID=3056915 RepID=A0ABT7WAQ2_9FLAO|nr:N-acyl homoserine lactonase family protein [Robiginitalea aurantiaca]MDM9630005.1 N-acyl homoserine lactonase family protein [Robiginitalea aurantiaca]